MTTEQRPEGLPFDEAAALADYRGTLDVYSMQRAHYLRACRGQHKRDSEAYEALLKENLLITEREADFIRTASTEWTKERDALKAELEYQKDCDELLGEVVIREQALLKKLTIAEAALKQIARSDDHRSSTLELVRLHARKGLEEIK